MKTVLRGLGTAAVLVLWALISTVISWYVPVLSGENAVQQLNNSDTDFVSSMAVARYLHLASTGWTVLCLTVLAAIWVGPVSRFFKKVNIQTLGAILLSVAVATAPMHQAHAYYSKSNYSDVVEILPNWTAFAIPETGKNLDSQGKFQSEDYLNKNKVAEKRYVVPHSKMPNTGLFSDYYVPDLRLVIVNREPVHREWVSSATKGTSAKDEGFSMETKDSININFGVTIGASIKEEDAAKYLYNFGTVAPTKGTNSNDEQTQDAITFASYVFARPLAEVMDTVARSQVQTALSEEFGSRSTIDAIHGKKEIMVAVAAKIRAYFEARGVTIEWIGFDSPLDYDHDSSGHSPIQDAINNVFIAEQQAAAAKTLETALPVLEKQAQIAVINGVAESAKKWQIPALPSVLVVPSNIGDIFSRWFPTASEQPTASTPQPAVKH